MKRVPVNKDETVNVHCILMRKYGVLVLSSGVNNLKSVFLSFNLDSFDGSWRGKKMTSNERKFKEKGECNYSLFSTVGS